MYGVGLFVLAAVVVLAGVFALLPLPFSWPFFVRWTVAGHTMGLIGPGGATYPMPDLRQLVLTRVGMNAGDLDVDVLEFGHPASHTSTFVGAAPEVEIVSMLREWCALRTPMLLYVDTFGSASLSGPVASVTSLRPIGASAALAM